MRKKNISDSERHHSHFDLLDIGSLLVFLLLGIHYGMNRSRPKRGEQSLRQSPFFGSKGPTPTAAKKHRNLFHFCGTIPAAIALAATGNIMGSAFGLDGVVVEWALARPLG
jgi:hypothetical protein